MRATVRGVAVWQLRWVDPMTGRRTTEVLGPVDDVHEADATLAAQRKSAEVANMGLRGNSGATGGAAGGTTVSTAIQLFIDSKSGLARSDGTNRTRDNYRKVLRKIIEPILASLGVMRLDQIDRPVLARLRARILARPELAAGSQNSYLVHCKAWLNGCRRLGLFEMHSDTIREGLERVRVDRTWPDVLTPQDCQQLLRDALAHDVKPGCRRRFAPWVALMLLSGARPGELRRLEWSACGGLSANTASMGLGEFSRGAAGLEIRAEHSKSRRSRYVDLSISPAGGILLAAMHEVRAHPRWVFPTSHRIRGSDGNVRETLAAPSADRVLKWCSRLSTDVAWDYDLLRHTASSYVAALRGPFYESQRHAHSVTVAERDYYGRVSVTAGVTTLEAALGIEAVLGEIVESLRG